MPERDGYETIKMIDRGDKCHIVMDYVKGDPLIYWLRYHPDISKQQLFTWIESIISQMERYHRSDSGACYRYLNPYSIIVTRNETLMLLDLEADSNGDILRNMQKRVIRTNFMPQDGTRRSKLETDLFCTGKTIQFLLAQTDASPKLTRREERLLSKMISRCIDSGKQSYGDFQSVLHQLPKQKSIGNKSHKITGNIHAINAKRHFRIGLLAVIAIVIAVCAILQPFPSSKGDNLGVSNNVQEIKAKETQQDTAHMDDDIYMDMGLLQFVQLQEYEKSKEYFTKISDHNEGAAYYIQMANYLLGNDSRETDAKIMEVLGKLEAFVQTENAKNWMYQFVAIIRVYGTQDSRTANEHILKLGKQLNSSVQWSEMSEELVMEVKNYMAVSYEEMNQNEDAVKCYVELIESWTDNNKVEGVYSSLCMLYKELEKPAEAIECAKQGIARYPSSTELKIDYMTLLCGEQSISRETCAQEIKKCMDADSKIKEEERFHILQKEYNITIDEGGKVWVGR